MYSSEKHLSPEEVEWLINGKGSDGAVGAPVEFWNEARQHLAQCAACEKLVHLHGEIHDRLVGLSGQPAQPSAENCPDEKFWRGLSRRNFARFRSRKIYGSRYRLQTLWPIIESCDGRSCRRDKSRRRIHNSTTSDQPCRLAAPASSRNGRGFKASERSTCSRKAVIQIYLFRNSSLAPLRCCLRAYRSYSSRRLDDSSSARTVRK